MNDPKDLLSGLRRPADPRDPRAAALLRPTSAGDQLEGRLAILGLPYDGGIPSRPGARFGPRAIREALAAFGSFDGERDLPVVRDLGDLALATTSGGVAHSRIEEGAARVFSSGALPIFLGGDHGCTGSVIRGLSRARPALKLALVTIDAHLDVREYDGVGDLSSGTPFRRAIETPLLDGSSVAMIGIRRFANSRHYLGWAERQRIRIVPVEEIAERGAAEAAREALTEVSAGADGVYLSIDIDAADAAFAPGASASGAGGLSSREMIELVRSIAANPMLVGADIMELSPPYDLDGRTAKLAARLLLEILSVAPIR